MSIEVMKLALEAFRYADNTDHELQRKAIFALEQAIEQAEQAQPVAWRTFDGEGNYDYRDYDMNEDYRDEYIKRNGTKYASWVEPLYTAPTQRKPWVGLTKQDVYDLFNKMIAQEGNNIDRRYQDFAKYLEAKLKETNRG